MATKAAPPSYKIAETGEATEAGHAKWKQKKVQIGLEQAEDRASMIPAEHVWRKLGLER
jgi:hypothetical protein